MSNKSLRIVTFNYNAFAFTRTRDWILNNNHKHLLAVTTAGPKSRPTPVHKEILAAAPRDLEVLVSTRMKSVVTPVIKALEPDLILCFSFPYRLSAELSAIPKYGAINVHPTPLPAYRGPNAPRAIYDGGPIGATVHWIAPEFDKGNILGQKIAPLPDIIDMPNVIQLYGGLIFGAIDEAVQKAIAGDAGQVQDESKATYATAFSAEEYWLNLDDTVRGLQEKMFALQMPTTDEPDTVKVALNGSNYVVTAIEEIPDLASDAPVGTCLEANAESLTVKVQDGVVKFLIAGE